MTEPPPHFSDLVHHILVIFQNMGHVSSQQLGSTNVTKLILKIKYEVGMWLCARLSTPEMIVSQKQDRTLSSNWSTSINNSKTARRVERLLSAESCRPIQSSEQWRGGRKDTGLMLVSVFSLLFGESKTGTKNVFCIKCAHVCHDFLHTVVLVSWRCWHHQKVKNKSGNNLISDHSDLNSAGRPDD